MKKLRGCPYVPQINEYHETSTQFIIIMEKIKNVDMEEYIRKLTKPLTEPKIKLVMKDLLQALCSLEEKGIVHRDIKPSNMIYCKISKKIKLLDFGLGVDLTNDFARKKKICGTENYTAPEILRNEPCEFKSDVFSAGIVFLFLLVLSFFYFISDK